MKHISIDVPQTATSFLVCLLFFLLVKPLRTLILSLTDRAHDCTQRKLWKERNGRQRSLIATCILLFLCSHGNVFFTHVEQYMEKSLASEFFRNFGVVPGKSAVDPNLPIRRLLVIGEVGDGKSTLVNAMRDKALSKEAIAGRGARGVTKEITAYTGLPIAGQRTEYLDTPGVGDKDITAQRLVSMLEERLGASNKGYVDGVLVTTPVSHGRITLGLQVVSAIVDKGFLGASEKWAHVILVGTKRDKADADDCKYFRDEIKKEFFSSAPGKDGKVALVSLDDYSELRQAISQLPDFGINYVPPSSAEMSAAMSNVLDVLNITLKDFETKLDDARQEEAARWRDEIARQKKDAAEQHKKLREDLIQKFEHDAQKLRNETHMLQQDLAVAMATAATAKGEARKQAREKAEELEARLIAKMEEMKLALKKQQEVDRAAQADEIAFLKEEVTQSKDEISKLRRKLAALEDTQPAKEHVKAELQSKEAELQSKELEVEAHEAKFNKSCKELEGEGQKVNTNQRQIDEKSGEESIGPPVEL